MIKSNSVCFFFDKGKHYDTKQLLLQAKKKYPYIEENRINEFINNGLLDSKTTKNGIIYNGHVIEDIALLDKLAEDYDYSTEELIQVVNYRKLLYACLRVMVKNASNKEKKLLQIALSNQLDSENTEKELNEKTELILKYYAKKGHNLVADVLKKLPQESSVFEQINSMATNLHQKDVKKLLKTVTKYSIEEWTWALSIIGKYEALLFNGYSPQVVFFHDDIVLHDNWSDIGFYNEMWEAYGSHTEGLMRARLSCPDEISFELINWQKTYKRIDKFKSISFFRTPYFKINRDNFGNINITRIKSKYIGTKCFNDRISKIYTLMNHDYKPKKHGTFGAFTEVSLWYDIKGKYNEFVADGINPAQKRYTEMKEYIKNKYGRVYSIDFIKRKIYSPFA